MKKFSVFICLMFIGGAHATTETVNWYKDGQTYAQTTCTVGGNIILPETPIKRGYNFTGWTVALYDFSTLDYTIDGTSYKSNSATQTWEAYFPYGKISGVYLCSGTYSTASVGVPDENSVGQNCWCKATKYIPNGSNVIYSSFPDLVWVNFGDRTNCDSVCGTVCGDLMKRRADYRQFFFITR